MADQIKKGLRVRHTIKETLDERIEDNSYGFMAERILPIKWVYETGGTVNTIGAGEGKKVQDTKRSAEGSFNRGSWQTGEEVFTTREFGFEMPTDSVSSLILENYFDVEVISAEVAVDTLLLAREKRVVDKLYNKKTFQGASYYKAVVKGWGQVGTTFWGDINDAFLEIRKRVAVRKKQLTLIVSELLIPLITMQMAKEEMFKYTQGDIAKASESQKLSFMAEYLGIKEIMPVATLFDKEQFLAKDSNGNPLASFDDLWSIDMAMLAKLDENKSGGGKWGGSLGRQPIFKPFHQKMGKGSTDHQYITETYHEDKVDADIQRVRSYRGEKVFEKYAFLFEGVAKTALPTP